MSNYVVEKKSKSYLYSAIITTILCLSPIGIIALVSIGNPNVWSAPYPKFMLYFLIIHTIFAFGVGYIGQIYKIAYKIFTSIVVIGTITLILLGYILGNPIIMHLATASLFVFELYLSSNAGGDNYFFRYSIPVIISISSLITILWFVGAGMSVIAHIVIVSILDLIFGLMVFFKLKDEFKHDFSFIEDKELSYTEETREEKRQAKLEKQSNRVAKRQTKVEKQEQKRSKKKRELTPEQLEEFEKARQSVLERQKKKMEKIYKKSPMYKREQRQKREEWKRKTFPGYYKVKDFINKAEIAVLDAELKAYDAFDKGMTILFGSDWEDGLRDTPKAASAHDAAVAFENAITRNSKLPPYEYYANCYVSSGHVVCELKISYLGGHSYADASEQITSYIMQNHSGALGGYDVEFMFK